jgi:plasmid stabilization system protein ParE
MNVVWSQTALDQLDEIYDIIASERDIATATKWFFKISDAVDGLADFPLSGPRIPECAFEEHFTDFVGLRHLIVRPYRIVYEATDTACNILAVMRTSRIVSLDNLGQS